MFKERPANLPEWIMFRLLLSGSFGTVELAGQALRLRAVRLSLASFGVDFPKQPPKPADDDTRQANSLQSESEIGRHDERL